MYDYPTVQDFKDFFSRDFPYAPDAVPPDPQDPKLGVTDKDITRAMMEAKLVFNGSFFPDEDSWDMGFLYVTAHFLVMDLRASAAGIGGSYQWATQSKSVGSVSESYAIPQKVIDNPQMAMLARTNYGAKYVTLILPYMVGPILVLHGRTLP